MLNFTSLSFRLYDEKRQCFTNINSELFVKYPLHVCDTLETIKSVISHVLNIPNEYISLWYPSDLEKDNNINTINQTLSSFKYIGLECKDSR